jgi:uncharacterized protein (DUF58 family)
MATPTALPRAGNTSDGIHPSTDELIQLRLLARDLPLRARARQSARSVLAGGHRSNFRGRGMDYLESRAYQSGDDIRNMDWRVTARSGRAHVKVYHEERERPVVVMADFGPGMFFATHGAFKSIIAARAAALIAWAAVDDGDRIGALLYNGKHRELRPAGGQRGALRLIRALVAAADPAGRPEQTTQPHNALNAALLRLRRVARPGSLVFIVSDFYNTDGDSRQHLQHLRRHNDVVACQILDRLELQPPVAGQYPVQHGEQQGILDTRSANRRQAWVEHFAARRRAVDALMQQCAVPLLRLTTGDDVAQSLRSALSRAGRTAAELAA